MIRRIRASVVCVAKEHLLVVRLRDPVSRSVLHFVPGGALEPFERPAQAAAREVLEETGLVVVVDEGSERIARYPFVWAGQTYDTTTHFFRAALAQPGAALPPVAPTGKPAPYQLGALWIPLADAAELLGFHETIWQVTRSLFEAARR